MNRTRHNHAVTLKEKNAFFLYISNIEINTNILESNKNVIHLPDHYCTFPDQEP